MRKIVAISMPEEMHEHLRRKAARSRYGSVSEFIRELIRRDFAASPVSSRRHESPEDRFYREVFPSRRPTNEVLDEYARGPRE